MILLTETVVQTTNKIPEWWEVIAGVIAIPVSIAGLFYTIFLIKKTKLESKKIELEIREKQKKINDLKFENPVIDSDLQISFRAANINNIILKFIFLWLIVNGWGLIADGVKAIFGVIYLTLKELFNFDLENHWIFYVVFGVMKLPLIAYWTSFLLLGSSLFKDLNKLLDLNFRNFFNFK